jgi:hypothetical protein
LRARSRNTPCFARFAGTQTLSYDVSLADIDMVKRVADPSLPKGAAFWASLHSRPQGLYFLADAADDAEAWVDALHLCAYMAANKQLGSLGHALTALEQRRNFMQADVLAHR